MAHGSGLLLGLLVALTLLLAAFIAAVVRANLDAAESPAPLAPPLAVPAHALSAGQPSALAPQPAAVQQPLRPAARTSPSGRGWRPMSVVIAFMVGLIIAAIGGWLFLSTGTGTCTAQAAAVCAQGYVLLTTTQVFGGAIALAGIALIFTAAFLALREQN